MPRVVAEQTPASLSCLFILFDSKLPSRSKPSSFLFHRGFSSFPLMLDYICTLHHSMVPAAAVWVGTLVSIMEHILIAPSHHQFCWDFHSSILGSLGSWG